MGWCLDGVLAYEMAHQLRAQGQEVSFLGMIDAFNPVYRKIENPWRARLARLRFHADNVAHLGFRSKAAYLRNCLGAIKNKGLQQLLRALYDRGFRKDRRSSCPQRAFDEVLRGVAVGYSPSPYQASVTLARPTTRRAGTYADCADGWRNLVAGLNVVDVPGDHREVFVAPNVKPMAASFTNALSVRVPQALACESSGTAFRLSGQRS